MKRERLGPEPYQRTPGPRNRYSFRWELWEAYNRIKRDTPLGDPNHERHYGRVLWSALSNMRKLDGEKLQWNVDFLGLSKLDLALATQAQIQRIHLSIERRRRVAKLTEAKSAAVGARLKEADYRDLNAKKLRTLDKFKRVPKK